MKDKTSTEYSRPLRYTVAGYVLLILIPILLGITLIHFFDNWRRTKEYYEYFRSYTESTLEQSILTVENAYTLYGDALDHQLSVVFEEFVQEYRDAEGNIHAIDLEELQERFGPRYDFYIINQDYTIIKTTYETDLGLDFSGFSNFRIFLDQLFESGEVVSPRITGETQTGTLRKYIYQASPDGEYILEVGMNSTGFSDLLENMDYTELAQRLSRGNSYVDLIRIFDGNGFLMGNVDVDVSDENREQVMNVILTEESQTLYDNFGRITRRLLFIQPPGISYEGELVRVVDILYNSDILNQRLFQSILFHGFLIMFALVAGVFISFFSSSRISRPIQRIVKDIEQIADGDLEHEIALETEDELKTLRNSIRKMITRLKDQMDVVKQYNTHLDSLVHDRTEKLQHANEALQKLTHELEDRVKQRTRELMDTNIELTHGIEEREHTEKLLRESEKDYREIVEYMQSGYYRMNLSGVIIMANSAFVHMLGFEEEQEVIGKNIQTFRGMNETEQHDFEKKLLMGKQFQQVKNRWRTKEGNPLIVKEHIYPRLDEEGTIEFYEGLVEDVTEQSLLEKQLVEAQKMEALGHLAGGIAHDFNNVLASISGAVQMVNLADNEEQLAEYTQMASEGLARAKSVTERLLTFTRYEHIETHAINCGEVLKNIKSIAEHTLPKEIETVVFDENSEKVMIGNEIQLQQVFINLCINAAAAMPGGGTIEIGITEKQHRVPKELQSTDFVTFYVRDYGIGMDEDTRRRVFEPFFTNRPDGSGTGLGLSVAYRIVQNHRGWIDLESAPGKGTVFYIGIPTDGSELEQEAEEPDESLEEIVEKEQTSGTILVVDDEIQLRRLMEKVLRKQGYSILTAIDGEDALEQFKTNQHAIDLVLTDIGMPKMGGVALIQKLKEIAPDQKILAVTGYIREEETGMLDQDSVMDVIQKPFDFKTLLSKVKSAIES